MRLPPRPRSWQVASDHFLRVVESDTRADHAHHEGRIDRERRADEPADHPPAVMPAKLSIPFILDHSGPVVMLRLTHPMCMRIRVAPSLEIGAVLARLEAGVGCWRALDPSHPRVSGL